MKNLRLLIVSVSAGAGHIRAAEAMKKLIEIKYPDIAVTHIDLVDYISIPSKKLFFESYEMLATELPRLWGFLYHSIDVPKRQRQFDHLTRIIKKIEAKRLIDTVNEIAPDYILSTHFTPPDVLYRQYDRLISKPRLGVIVTDYAVHQFWTDCHADDYFVSTDSMRWKLKRNGIPEERIILSGIPVDPSFSENRDISTLKNTHHIPTGKEVVLTLAGGRGMAGIEDIVKALCQTRKPLHIIAIAGKNEPRKRALEKIKPPDHISVHVIGWTDAMDDIMRTADVVITKSGGLTVTEAITLRKPLIVVHPIPGQEERNAEYILEQRYGVIAHTDDDLLYYIEQNPISLAPGYDGQTKTSRTAGEIIMEKIQAGTSHV